MKPVSQTIADELGIREAQVVAVMTLLNDGATVPFIARYRKEATGMLDDIQLRKLEERLGYLVELEARKGSVADSIRAQGLLTPAIEAAIGSAETKARLEDIYLPFQVKRRTKAQTAREAGLCPLADALLADPSLAPEARAGAFIGETVPDQKAALDGARSILVEKFAEDADLVGTLREELWSNGRMKATVRDGMEKTGAKYSDYFDYASPLAKLPPHRTMAMFRAEREGVISLDLGDDADTGKGSSSYEARIAARHGIAAKGRPGDGWLADTVRWAWVTRIRASLAVSLRVRLLQEAEREAIRVFSSNLRDLLLAAPAGPRATMGLDPGFRTGVKVAVVDVTGKVVATTAVFPHEPQNRTNEAILELAKLVQKHKVELIAIGNGTASRETDRLAGELIKRLGEAKVAQVTKVTVSEAGASVYSASEYASQEFPDMDVTLRGAVSIARRLQDPLAELTKVPPKSIGVGQYQHDVDENALSRSLDTVVEDCVNAVGVDLNTASVPLLSKVSGIGEGLARNIVAHRDANGAFRSRSELLQVPRLGGRAFEQCAGFLRIRGGENPLDMSGVHPEAYPVVEKILRETKSDIKVLIGRTDVLRKLKPAAFADERFGVPTVTDILKELEKPGRDPRPAFKTAEFKDGVEKPSDLKPGMKLQGTVTNVAGFGAFVDIGVHQDGLVHVSALSKTFVKDPRDVVKPGDVVSVKVLEVDVARNRISLTMRLDDPLPAPGSKTSSRDRMPSGARSFTGGPAGGSMGGAFAGAFASAIMKAETKGKDR